MSQGRFDQAEEVMSQVPLTFPQSSVIFNTLGEVRARQGKWAAAVSNLTKSLTADPTNQLAYDYLAPLLVQAGNLGAYRTHTELILRRFGSTTDPAVAARMARDCLILPPAPAQLERLAKMADLAVAAGPNDKSWPDFQFVKGLAEYRQGHFASAEKWLQETLAQSKDAALTVQADMLLAMTQFQLKQIDEARATLAKGVQLADAKFPKPNVANWSDELTARVLMHEARTLLLGGAATDEKVESDGSTTPK
jgi:tetratricopeptide (TPR) repeat protein